MVTVLLSSAKWCKYCNDIAPEWDKLVTQLADAPKVSCFKKDEHDDVPKGLEQLFSIIDGKGYPHIIFGGFDTYRIYAGKRTSEDIIYALEQFIKEKN